MTPPATTRERSVPTAARIVAVHRQALCQAARVDQGTFEHVIEEGRALQERLASLVPVAVGGTEDWKQLYGLCHDPAIARAVASVLPLRDPDLLAPARLWKFLLEDLHPDLRIEWDEQRHNIGV